MVPNKRKLIRYTKRVIKGSSQLEERLDSLNLYVIIRTRNPNHSRRERRLHIMTGNGSWTVLEPKVNPNKLNLIKDYGSKKSMALHINLTNA